MVLGSEEEAAETLELGVDAYMAKPPNLRELIARVRSLLRRRERYYPPGGNSGDEISGSLAGRGGCPNGLTRTEFRLASCLACNRGTLVSYCRLIDEVWGGKAISLDTLHFFIRRLRSKFGGSAIFGIRGVGYCFKDTTG
jgi:DNA-binding response OmpR family regulator